MTVGEQSGIQDDQRDRPSNVVHSIVIDSEESNTEEDEWEEDVLCNLLARRSNNVGGDMFRGSCEVERVQEVEFAECKYNSKACDQVISKPYICDVCNKAFAKSNYLQMYKHTHTSYKRYLVRNKSKQKISSLNRRKRIHSVNKLRIRNKEYICDICNKTFSHLCRLNTHKRTHTSKKLYLCNICNKTCSQLCSE